MAPAESDGAARTLRWLEPRLERVPEDLGRAVRECVRRTADGAGGTGADDAEPSVPDLLARCALDELDRVTGDPGDRRSAVRLLAADAALTWAFEAAADLGGDVPALADAVGLEGRIARRLEASADREGGGEGAPE